MANVGRAEVDVVAELSQFGKNLQRDLQRIVDKVKVDGTKVGNNIGDGISQGVDRAATSLKRLPGQAKESLEETADTADKVRKRISDGFEETYKRVRHTFSRLSNVLFTFRSRVIGLGAVVTIALAGIVAATDELLGLLLPAPALLAGVGVAVATLNVALLGMGDAFAAAGEDSEKFEEAIKNLAPAAQAVVREFRDLMPLFQSIRIDVQTAFWEQLQGVLTRVAYNLGGPVRAGMVAVAQAAGGVVLELAKFLAQTETARVLNLVFQQTAIAFDNIAAATVPFLEGMRTLVEVFAPQIAAMTQDLAQGAEEFRDWAAAAQESGEAIQRFKQAMEFLNTLGQIVAGTFRLIDSAVRASHDAGVDLFRTIADLIDQAADLSATVEAQQGLQQFFQSIDRLIRALLPVLGAAAVQIGRLTTPLADLVTAIAPGVKAAFEGIADALIAVVDSGGQEFMDALSDALIIVAPHLQTLGRALGELLAAVAPLLAPLARLVGFILEFAAGIARLIIPFIEPLTTFLAAVLTPLFEALLALAEAALPPLAEAFQRVSDKVTPLIAALGEALLTHLRDSLPFYIAALTAVIDGIVFIIDAWIASQELLVLALQNVWAWIKDNIIPIIRDQLWPVIRDELIPALKDAKAEFDKLWQAIKDLWEELLTLVRVIVDEIDPDMSDFEFIVMNVRLAVLFLIAAIKTVTQVLRFLIDLIGPAIKVLSNMAKAVHSVRLRWDNMKEAIKGVYSNLKSIIDRGVRVVDTLKAIGTAAKNLATAIYNIPSIPTGLGGLASFFADGGIVTRATAAVIGEAGPEVVLPLTRPARARELAAESGLMNVLMAGTGSGVRRAAAGARGDSSGPAVVVEAGAVVIKFEGMPDDQQARRVGNAAGEGLLNTLAARNIRLAVKGL